MSGTLDHQGRQGFPKIGGPMVDGEGRITRPWFRLLVSLWQGSGLSTAQLPNLVYLALSGSVLQAVNALTGELIGNVQTGSVSGGPALSVALGANPTTYVPTKPGTLVVSLAQTGNLTEAKVELARGTSGWVLVSLVGGAVPALLGDSFRISWGSDFSPPTAIFFPTNYT